MSKKTAVRKTGFITKYALTRGIYAVTVQFGGLDNVYCYEVDVANRIIYPAWCIEREFFETREEAECCAKEMAKKRVALLKKQLAKMEKLLVTPKWVKEK